MAIGRVGRLWTQSGVCRARCWRQDSVLDLDIRAFFRSRSVGPRSEGGTSPHRPALGPVARGAVAQAPLRREDGSLVERDRGTPQGSAISPLLANMFLPYAFDAWLADYPGVRFERYCDDVIVHAASERQALQLRAAIAQRLAECGLELNEHKTRIVYCKDATRRRSHEHERFTFSGTRSARGWPGVSVGASSSTSSRRSAATSVSASGGSSAAGGCIVGRAAPSPTWPRRSTPTSRGWINLYGRFYRSELVRLLRRINEYLIRWARWKYKRLGRYLAKARTLIAAVFRREPGLFAHLRFGAPTVGRREPDELRGSRPVVCERRGVRFPSATHPGPARWLPDARPDAKAESA
jgi:RNA-directed DNA polymerase